MGPNVLVFAWNRSLPGRESLSAQHFQDFMQYLSDEQSKGQIDSFEPVLLEAHGGSVNGWVLIRGDSGKLSDLANSRSWVEHVTRALHHLDGASVLRGVTGPVLMERMDMWTRAIPGRS